MKRFAIFISLHLFLFLLVIAYEAQSSEWTIDKYKTLTFARVSGVVTHGDNLNFWIRAEDGIRDLVRSRGLGDVYKRQPIRSAN